MTYSEFMFGVSNCILKWCSNTWKYKETIPEIKRYSWKGKHKRFIPHSFGGGKKGGNRFKKQMNTRKIITSISLWTNLFQLNLSLKLYQYLTHCKIPLKTIGHSYIFKCLLDRGLTSQGELFAQQSNCLWLGKILLLYCSHYGLFYTIKLLQTSYHKCFVPSSTQTLSHYQLAQFGF